MNQLLDIIGRWDHFGQAIFFLIVLGMLASMVGSVFKYIAVCFRGWPPCESEDSDDE